jgi:CheY-like chemotaxis protein
MSDRIALLVEGESPAESGIVGWLQEAGWTIDACRTGSDALRRLADGLPDLVIADVMLAGLDGPSLSANLRMRPYGDKVAIILTSPREDAREASLAAGADAFLLQPLTRDELFRTVVEVCAARAAASAAGSDELLRPVRVPSTSTAAFEEGELTPAVFLALLRRFHDERLDGVLEVEASSGFRAKLAFSQGSPSAARSSDPETGFGNLLLRLGFVSAQHLDSSIEEGRRTGAPLGEVLLRLKLIERRAVDQTLRAQVLERAVGIGRVERGRYVLDPSEAIGLAGFDVPAGAVAWRLGHHGAPLSDAQQHRHIRCTPELLGAWSLLDPDNTLGVLRALLVGGATPADCERVSGARAAALTATLVEWGLVALVDDVPSVATRDAGLAELDVGDLADELLSEHRSLLDADLYTVLGVLPDADADELTAATTAGLARRRADALPGTLDAASRERARAIHDRILEAGRVLSDPRRRAIYDARLGSSSSGHREPLGMEDHAVLQAERASELFRRGEFVTAATVFNIAIQLEGESADILAMLGWARHCACPEDPAAGEPELRRALVVDPTDEFALTYLGQLMASRGEIDAARQLLREALHKNHEFAPARDALQRLT